MVTHNAKAIELKAKFFLASLDCHQQNFFACELGETKISVIAADSDVVTTVWFEVTRLARHGWQSIVELLFFIQSMARVASSIPGRAWDCSMGGSASRGDSLRLWRQSLQVGSTGRAW